MQSESKTRIKGARRCFSLTLSSPQVLAKPHVAHHRARGPPRTRGRRGGCRGAAVGSCGVGWARRARAGRVRLSLALYYYIRAEARFRGALPRLACTRPTRSGHACGDGGPVRIRTGAAPTVSSQRFTRRVTSCRWTQRQRTRRGSPARAASGSLAKTHGATERACQRRIAQSWSCCKGHAALASRVQGDTLYGPVASWRAAAASRYVWREVMYWVS